MDKTSNQEKCPNACGCQLLHLSGFLKDEAQKEYYKTTFCIDDSPNGFQKCRRFQTKKALNLCPDFVLPDSLLTIDEIMEKMEE
ncbi:MAG: hypothetical protein LBH92_04455 [Bacteroidales bacterium]|jgi:hypothetical protein|nr:hypothetical protein [Bacteroidales bacterium]